MKDDKQKSAHTNRINHTKKSYQQPELQVYGDLRDITQTLGNMGAKDGGSGKTHGTQP